MIHKHTYEHTIEVRADSSTSGDELEIVIYDDAAQDAWSVPFSALIAEFAEDDGSHTLLPDMIDAEFAFAKTLEKLASRLVGAAAVVRSKAERSRRRREGVPA